MIKQDQGNVIPLIFLTKKIYIYKIDTQKKDERERERRK